MGQKGQSYYGQRGEFCLAKRVKVEWLFQLLSLISQSEKDREELDAAMKNGDRHKLREITHRMQPMWEFLRMEEPLLAYRALLKDSKTSDKELKEYTRQIIDSTAMLIKAAEAEIKRLTNETEDTDS